MLNFIAELSEANIDIELLINTYAGLHENLFPGDCYKLNNLQMLGYWK